MNYTSYERFSEDVERNESPIGIVALWRLLWNNKLRILVPAIILTVLAGLLAYRAADTYTAEAQMLLARGNLEIVEFDSAGNGEVTQGAITNALIILGSRSLALQVVGTLDLVNDPEINPNLSLPPGTDPGEIYSDAVVREYALDWLADVTEVTILPGGSAISVRVTTTVPEKSAAIANAYVDSYLDYQVLRGQSETERAAAALETRVNELQLQLGSHQERLQDLRAQAPGNMLQSADALAGESVNMRDRLTTTRDGLAVVDAAIARLTDLPAGDLAALRSAIDADETLSRLEQATLQRRVGSETLQQDVQAIQTALQSERRRLARLEVALRDGLDAINNRIEEFNSFSIALRQLEVEVETTSQVYEASLARLKELTIQTGLRDAGAQVLARAEAPLRTDAQGRRRMVAIAGFLGLFLGMAYVLLREAANDRVRKVSDLMTITGGDAIIKLPPPPKGIFKLRGKGLSARAKKKTVGFSDSIRALRHRLTSGERRTSGCLIAGVFSSLPNEGKTTVARTLAQSFAMIDRRVIVIDADIRAGRLSRGLGMAEDKPGLREVLGSGIESSDLIIPLAHEGYDLLPSGKSDAYSTDLLESRLFVELLAALRARYDVVIFDTPPILILPDAPQIAAHMDTAILVTEYDRTPRAAVADAMTALKAVNVTHPVVALCNAPRTFGQDYGVPKQAYAKYLG